MDGRMESLVWNWPCKVASEQARSTGFVIRFQSSSAPKPGYRNSFAARSEQLTRGNQHSVLCAGCFSGPVGISSECSPGHPVTSQHSNQG